jgi:MFS family permease
LTDLGPRRTRAFSSLFGLFFAGVAVGPIIGGYSIEIMGSILAPFYISVVACFLNICAIIFILPESLPKGHQMLAREKNAARRERRQMSHEEAVRETDGAFWRRSVTRLLHNLGSLFAFARPMAMLLPRRRVVSDGDAAELGSNTKGRRDWNITVIAVASGLYSMMIVSRHDQSYFR